MDDGFCDMCNANIEFKDVEFVYPSIRRDLKQTLSRTPTDRLESSFKLVIPSLHLTEGDSLGLIGLNGAGKTTFLRLASEILIPTKGEIDVQGKISTILGDGFGFEMEMTGYENVFSRLLLQGYELSKIEEIIFEISEFAELNDAIHRPVKTYSTGMLMRLAFTTATIRFPEILIMDEVIGAGDASFVKKARERIDSFLSAAKIILLASHNAEYLKMYCRNGMWIENGIVRQTGSINEVLDSYFRETIL